MRYEKLRFVECVSVAILAALLMVSFQLALADTQETSLNQALKSVKQAEKMAGEKEVKKELKNVEKVLSAACKDLKKKNVESTVNKMKVALKALSNILSHPGAQGKNLQGKINGALKNLYTAIRRTGGYNITTKTSHGLHTVTLNTARGKININLPGEMAAGEPISGSLYVHSIGRTNAEKTTNESVLNGHMVEIEEIKGQRVPVTKKLNSWNIPKTAKVVHVVFTDKDGIEVGRQEVPVYPAYQPSESSDFELPSIGLTGRFLMIPGPFDGDFSNTEVRIGVSSANLLAESPSGSTVHTPINGIGQTKITLKEGDIETSGKFRLASLSITAGKLNLRAGETTTLTVTVKGLNELNDPVPLSLLNRTPAVVRMAGGSFQFRVIRGDDIKPGGIYTLTRTLTGKNPGKFQIWAEINPQLVREAKKLGRLTGKKFKNEGFSEKEIVNGIGKDPLNFVIDDLDYYKEGALDPDDLLDYLKGLMAVHLLDFFNSAEPKDQQWLRNIYIDHVFKGFRE